MDIKGSVQKGIDFLDSSPEVPNDWFERIDLENLDVSSLGNCVLGQVRRMIGDWYFGSYLASLGFESEHVEMLAEQSEPGDEEYRLLTIEWTKRIREKRNAS